MKKQIWKYELQIKNLQEIEMPIGAEILTVQVQDNLPVLWALVDVQAEKERRVIEVLGTGNNIHYGMGASRKYISTFQTIGGFVGHVFEYTGI
jgi:hypothetical protein